MRSWLLGHATNSEGGTGCSVLLFPEGAVASCDVRGGAPATRETALLDPACMLEKVNAVLLSGGSAFGLDAAAGVSSWCREHRMGFETGYGVVPIVPAACLFDLPAGDSNAFPDAAMARTACASAVPFVETLPMGNIGAGTGATVGKYLGLANAMKAGFGWSLRKCGHAEVVALAFVNAFGAIRDTDGTFLAGAREGNNILPPDGGSCASPAHWGTNTTLVAVVTDAVLSKSECRRIAIMGHNGLASSVYPAHTPFDGDIVFCLSTPRVAADSLQIGIAAIDSVAEAIRNAVRSASSAYGYPALSDNFPDPDPRLFADACPG